MLCTNFRTFLQKSTLLGFFFYFFKNQSIKWFFNLPTSFWENLIGIPKCNTHTHTHAVSLARPLREDWNTDSHGWWWCNSQQLSTSWNYSKLLCQNSGRLYWTPGYKHTTGINARFTKSECQQNVLNNHILGLRVQKKSQPPMCTHRSVIVLAL